MTASFYAKLGIFSKTLTIEQINVLLGLECDKYFNTGDIIRPHGIVHVKENQWFIYSRINREEPLENHVRDVLDRISHRKKEIRKIAAQPETDVELSCVIHSKDSPGINFTRETVSILHQIGASVDVDLYYWEYE